MIGSIGAIVIYLGRLYFEVWDIVPQEHKWWIGLAIVLLFLWEPTKRTMIVKKVAT